MTGIYRKLGTLGATLVVAAGTGSFALQARNSYQPQYYQSNNPSRSIIMQAQDELRDEGYYHGRVDGRLNGRFQQSVREYQRTMRLPATGQLDHRTIRSLGVTW